MNKNIPIHAPKNLVEAVRLTDLTLTAWDSSDASFLLENRASKEIIYITLVLKYQLKEGEYSPAVVYEAAADTKQPSEYLIPAQRVHLLPHPVLPQQKQWITGSSPYTPVECPLSAELTMIDIRYGDQSKLKWESPGWWTEPLLSDFPEYLSIPDSEAWTSDEYYFLARINREGQLQEALPVAPTVSVPSGTVAAALKRLTFFPSLEEGKPRGADIILVVKLNKSRSAKGNSHSLAEEPAISKPLVIMPLHPRDSQEIDWDFVFGGGWSYRTCRPNREY
jgi:hypothetical protein